MNQSHTRLSGITATVIAHEDQDSRLVMVSLEADQASDEASLHQPIVAALVIDRSGSMMGSKLALATRAASEFIASLSPEDRVCVVSYDDAVSVVAGLQAPSAAIARKAAKITSGGSTNLYEGWVTGAKMLGQGGRVILLSDGQANVGRFIDAQSLGLHAAKSWSRYGISTTTIGIGSDYDECLMSAMAQKGGGSHYFALSPEAIQRAFRDERHQLGSRAVANATLRLGSTTLEVGDLFYGEIKRRVFRVNDLSGPLTLRAVLPGSHDAQVVSIGMPERFGYSDEARLEGLLQDASSLQREMFRVVDSNSAASMKDRVRSATLRLLQHPSADDPSVRAVVQELQECLERLSRLAVQYEESDAAVHRKESFQLGHNLAEPSRSFSYDVSKADPMRDMTMARIRARHGEIRVDEAAFALAPREVWAGWKALPIKVSRAVVTVVLEDFKNSYHTAEIERVIGRRVRAEPGYYDGDQLVQIILGSQS